MDAEERIQAASKFLLQSPPGEINDVLNGKPTTSPKSRPDLNYPDPSQMSVTSSRTTSHCKPAFFLLLESTISFSSPPRMYLDTSIRLV